jgi:tetratricopeptide (TPR) repeat protein
MRISPPPFRLRLLAVCLLVAGMSMSAIHCPAADDSLELYFERLRDRGLFSIAESYAVSRLSQANLPRERHIDLTIELSRTLAVHAEFASERQQKELWKRARSIVDEERDREPSGPFAILLAAQSAMVPAGEAEWLRLECELKPFDEALATRARQQCSLAVQLLSTSEHELLSPPRDSGTGKEAAGGPSTHTYRVWLHRVRLALAQSLRNRAELTPADARQRTLDLVDAELTARKLVSVADEQVSFRAKLLLAASQRLKGELNRADEMLSALEKGIAAVDDNLLDEVAAERIRVLLERHQAVTALEVTKHIRTGRQRLSGELWFLRTRALVAVRDLAAARNDKDLAASLRAEAELTLQRCDEQVGGFWSRRCRALWEATRTAEKYGPELDALMQQARADFLGGRIEPALKGYARGEVAARASGQTDLALELGYTRASILLQEKQYESAATEFLRLADEYPQGARVAAAHLNGAYCLGRLYDGQKTQSRRERYTEALDRHIEQFAADPTADDARFFKAQLEEQRLQATGALPLYLKVAASHPRSAEARAGAARCFETIMVRMRERRLPSLDFERTAIDTLQQFIPPVKDKISDAPWAAAQSEVALHLSAILLLTDPPRFDLAEPLLGRVVERTLQIKDDDEQADRWRRIHQRAESLRVVAMAGNGRPLEAERLLDSLAAASPRDLLVIVELLAPFASSQNRQRQVQYVALQLHAIRQLSKHRGELSRDEQGQLDQSLARAYLANGQITKALEIYERQAADAAKDANRQREIAVLLSETGQRECIVLARQCWRRIESLTKQGTPDWLGARLGVISTGIKLGDTAEAKKLLAVTRLLYPELGGADLKSRFLAAERELADDKPRDGR